MNIFCVLFSFLFFCFPLTAEIEIVTIKWTPGLCQDSCVKGLVQQFGRIRAVKEAAIDQRNAQANLRWKPDFPFTFTPINVAMRMIGLAIQDLRIRVRGNVIHDDESVSLISIGDNTPFILLGPIVPRSNRQVIESNPATHLLPPPLRAQLLDSEEKQYPVVIEGPLLEAYRSPPLYLIVERINVLKPRK